MIEHCFLSFTQQQALSRKQFNIDNLIIEDIQPKLWGKHIATLDISYTTKCTKVQRQTTFQQYLVTNYTNNEKDIYFPYSSIESIMTSVCIPGGSKNPERKEYLELLGYLLENENFELSQNFDYRYSRTQSSFVKNCDTLSTINMADLYFKSLHARFVTLKYCGVAYLRGDKI